MPRQWTPQKWENKFGEKNIPKSKNKHILYILSYNGFLQARRDTTNSLFSKCEYGATVNKCKKNEKILSI